jgi:hypothetical protein
MSQKRAKNFGGKARGKAKSLKSGTVGWVLSMPAFSVDKPIKFARSMPGFVSGFCLWPNTKVEPVGAKASGFS